MPPKKAKKGGKAKNDAPQEPEQDATWHKAVETGIWERPVTALPDAGTWPTWGALRERVLASCKEVRVVNSPTVRDAFVSEVVNLSPPDLRVLDLRGSQNLHRVVLSPLSSCPKLEQLGLARCPGLEYVLLQSHSIRALDLTHCTGLTKALLHCPKLQTLKISECPQLETLVVWSDELKDLDLSGCNGLVQLKLQCPELSSSTVLPQLKPAPGPAKLAHPPLACLLKEACKQVAQQAAEEKERLASKLSFETTVIPAAYKPLA